MHADHVGARGVRAVRGARDQTHRAVRLAATRVIRADREQTRVLALRPGVRLDRDRRVARACAEHALELGDEPRITLGLIAGRERMERREARPRDREHLDGGVELHRARAQRNHRAIEREVFVGEPTQIPKHLRLRAMRREDGMREIGRAALELRGHSLACARLDGFE